MDPTSVATAEGEAVTDAAHVLCIEFLQRMARAAPVKHHCHGRVAATCDGFEASSGRAVAVLYVAGRGAVASPSVAASGRDEVGAPYSEWPPVGAHLRRERASATLERSPQRALWRQCRGLAEALSAQATAWQTRDTIGIDLTGGALGSSTVCVAALRHAVNQKRPRR